MNVVDSSGWLAWFLDEPNAGRFEAPIRATDELVVPSIVLLEVYRHVRRSVGVEEAVAAAAVLQQGRIADMTCALALVAAELSVVHSLPVADSIVLATTREHGATLWTQDSDFDGLESVEFIPRS